VAIWGSSWLAITYQLGSVAPEASIVYRFLLAAAILMAWCVMRGLRLRFSLKDHLFIGAAGGAPVLDQLHHLLFCDDVSDERACGGDLLDDRHHEHRVRCPAARHAESARGWRLRVCSGSAGSFSCFWSDIADFNLGSGGLTGLGLSLVATVSASLGNIASARNQRAGIPWIQGNAFGMVYGALFTASRRIRSRRALHLRLPGSLSRLAVLISRSSRR
jgi:drug/metabolite transporter (DMT)-like permease